MSSQHLSQADEIFRGAGIPVQFPDLCFTALSLGN